MFRFVLFLCCLTTAGVAQTIPGVIIPGVSEPLKTYLQLTDAQSRDVARINGEFRTWQLSRYLRQAEVQAELAVETAKSPLDPMALGVRLAEVESIRREIRDETARVRARQLALLSDAQKEKLKSLEQARALQPVASAAECENLLAPAPATIVARVGISPIPFPAVPATVPQPSAACGSIAFGILTPAPLP